MTQQTVGIVLGLVGLAIFFVAAYLSGRLHERRLIADWLADQPSWRCHGPLLADDVDRGNHRRG